MRPEFSSLLYVVNSGRNISYLLGGVFDYEENKEAQAIKPELLKKIIIENTIPESNH